VVSFYHLANGLDRPMWMERAAEALLARLDAWIGRKELHEFALELAEYVGAPERKQYDEALRLCAALQDETTEGTRMRQRAMVAHAELLLHCFGKTQEALVLLRRAGWERNSDKQTTRRLGMAQAEALIGIGSIDEARQILSKLEGERKDADARRRDIKHAGLIQQASQLVRDQQDPAQFDHAMAMLDEVLREDPMRLLSPVWNNVRLDVHLGRGEYRIARHLAERLAQLDMTAYDRAQVLVRHVKALCGAGEGAQAKAVCERLFQLSGQSSEVLEARNAVTQTEAGTHSR